MTTAPNATHQAIVDAAVDATGASHGWLLALREGALHAVAATGTGAGSAIGTVLDATTGSAGYVVSSGQPLALQPRPDASQPWAAPHTLLGRTPKSIVAVPCAHDGGIAGVLELVDKADGPFSFDDVEIVTVLGNVAGAALTASGDADSDVRDPADLARELTRLADDDIAAYVRVARVVDALLAHG